MPNDWKVPALPAPTFGTDPAGNAYAVTQNRKGESHLGYAPKANSNSVEIKLPGKEAEASLDFLKGDLKERQSGAGVARDLLATNTQVIDALEQGAKAGGGETLKQGLRKLTQAFNIDLPATASTEQLSQALGNRLLSEAGKLKPVSNEDMKQLAKIVGSIDTDPTALTRALAFTNALALKGLSGYHEYVDYQINNLQTPYARDMFGGARIGYDLPTQLTGPMSLQLDTVRNLKNLGGDITKLRDPTGQPFDLNSRFQVDPKKGFPGIDQPKAPLTAPAAPARNWEQLSPDEKQRVLQYLQQGK